MTTQASRPGRRELPQYRLGVLADVHGDILALRDALAQLDRLGADQVVCAGDLIDWGPSPGRCIEVLAERGVPCVRGNHDSVDAGGGIFDPLAFPPGPAIAFIDQLPAIWESTIAGVRVVVCHGSPYNVMAGITPERDDIGAILARANAEVMIVGHTHVPMHLSCPAGHIVNPGSVLERALSEESIPASGTFGLLELPAGRFSVYRAGDGRRVRYARRKGTAA